MQPFCIFSTCSLGLWSSSCLPCMRTTTARSRFRWSRASKPRTTDDEYLRRVSVRTEQNEVAVMDGARLGEWVRARSCTPWSCRSTSCSSPPSRPPGGESPLYRLFFRERAWGCFGAFFGEKSASWWEGWKGFQLMAVGVWKGRMCGCGGGNLLLKKFQRVLVIMFREKSEKATSLMLFQLWWRISLCPMLKWSAYGCIQREWKC